MTIWSNISGGCQNLIEFRTMKKKNLYLFQTRRSTTITAVIGLLLVGFTLMLDWVGESHAFQKETSQIYIPLVLSNPRQAPVPKLVASIRLEGARCPNDMTFNNHSGLLYITNRETKNISVIRDKGFVGNIPSLNWPNFIESDPLSDRVYVSNMMSGITIVNGVENSGHIPAYGESYYITVNPVNGYTYVTDLRDRITIIRGSEKVMDLKVPAFEGQKVGWQLTADYDRLTGLTYFATSQNGVMSVIDGTEVVDQFFFEGKGASDMIVDANRRLIVVANLHAHEDSESPNNISIIDLDSKEVTSVFSGKNSKNVGLDPVTGYVYVSNPDDNSVTVLQGKREVATYWSGKTPKYVAVDSVRGFAYIANSAENSVSVFRDGVPVTTIELPEDMGFKPNRVAIDEEAGRVYILNNTTVDKPSYPERQVTVCKRPWVHILE